MSDFPTESADDFLTAYRRRIARGERRARIKATKAAETKTIMDDLADLLDPSGHLDGTERLHRAYAVHQAAVEHLRARRQEELAALRAGAPHPEEPDGTWVYRDPTGNLAVSRVMRGAR